MYKFDDRSCGDELISFLLTPSRLERLKIRSDGRFSLPTLPPDTASLRLREFVISKCSFWQNHRFGSLTSLSLLFQNDIDANIYSLLDVLRCSPHLEKLVLEKGPVFSTALRQPPEHNVLVVPLRSLRRLHACRLAVETTRRLLGALDLSPNGIFMRFMNISADPSTIFPETVTPEVSSRAATEVELIYPPKCGVIIHTTNGVAHTRLAHRYPTDYSRFGQALCWITEKPRGEHLLKELWLQIDRKDYGVSSPRALCDLETLIIEVDANRNIDSVFSLMLPPNEDDVPSPLLSTLELRNVLIFAGTPKARSDAGSRLKTLRIRWFTGCEVWMMPLVHFFDKLDFYHVDNKTSRGLELPEECMTKSR